jgi:hypothetical protein
MYKKLSKIGREIFDYFSGRDTIQDYRGRKAACEQFYEGKELDEIKKQIFFIRNSHLIANTLVNIATFNLILLSYVERSLLPLSLVALSESARFFCKKNGKIYRRLFWENLKWDIEKMEYDEGREKTHRYREEWMDTGEYRPRID